ncbi:MAG TPA: tetratricopeptide repeat protein [Granulicella sp.]|jgi:predicted Zn-dependent protease|nr:tetratricopeptide repeat protein [Granulicella sp.]
MSFRNNARYGLLLGAALGVTTLAAAQLPAGTSDASPAASSASKAAGPNDALLSQADDALEKSDYATAVKLLTQLTADTPANAKGAKDPHLLFDLGYGEEGLGHAGEAEAAYRRAIAADPQYFEAHLALGLLLAREDKLPEARAELKAAIGVPEHNAALVARALRALAHIDLANSPADARDELLTALKISPETADDSLLAAQAAERLQDYAGAEAEYRRLLKADPGDVTATAGLAHTLLREKKSSEAETLLVAALQAHAGDPALTALLAEIYASADDPASSAKAVPLVEELHQQHPADTSITRLLARLYTKAGQPEKAEPLYTALVKQQPQDPTLLDDLGSTLIHLRRYAEAETLLERAVTTPTAFPANEDLAAAYSDLAFAASENSDPKVTLQVLELRAKISAETAGSLFLRATSYDKLHQVKQASAAYQAFLNLANGKFPDQEWQARHRLIALEHMK